MTGLPATAAAGPRPRTRRDGSPTLTAAGGPAPAPVAGDRHRPARSAAARRAVGAVRRLAAIGLTIRSQRRSRALAPPADLVPRHGLHGHPGRARPRRDRHGTRSSTTRATSTSTPANLARTARPARAAVRPDRAGLGAARRPGRSPSTTPTPTSWPERLRVPAPARRDELLVPLRPAAARRRAASTTRWACRPSSGSSCTTAACSPDRGIEQLMEAIPASRRRDARADGLRRRSSRRCESRAADPALAGRLRVAAGRPARTSCSTGSPPRTSWRCRSSRRRSTTG